MSPSNQVYSAFSFIGFVFCAIPFYWHLEAWNTGTCLYMAWTGIGCLMACINSIVWNNNMIIRAPIYCDIVVRIQAGLNVAVPAASLCINRRLYKIATIKSVTVTDSEKRRAVIVDLLIGIGIPILEMIAEYIVAYQRFDIYEDIGPSLSPAFLIETVLFFSMWPLVIGCVSFVYGVLTIYTLLKRERQFSQVISSNRNLNRGRYFRLMALAGVDVLCTVPLAAYLLHNVTKEHPPGWKSWTATHHDGHYSSISQIPTFIWRDIPGYTFELEFPRWALVGCSFLFFAFFGFADEARQHYRLAFKSVASRVGFSTSSTSSFTAHGPSHATSSLPYMKNKGEASVSVVTTSGNKRDSIDSFTDQISIPSISIPSNFKPDIKVEEFSPSDSMASSSKDTFELGPQGASHQPVVTLPAIPPASVPPHHADSTELTVRAYSSDAANAV